MEIASVEDPEDPRLADYRGIRDPQWLSRRGLFIAEGRKILEVLLRRRDLACRSLLLTGPALEVLRPALEDRPNAPPVYLASPVLLRAVGGYRFHQGALAAARLPSTPSLAELVATLPPEASRLALALESVTNPDNVGSAFRNAYAFGAGFVLLNRRCAHPLYRKTLRTSMGASLRVPFAWAADWFAGLRELHEVGYQLVGLSPKGTGGVRALGELAADRRIALVVGHEGAGLSDETVAQCDALVRIPMVPAADSLNVATASGIALYLASGL